MSVIHSLLEISHNANKQINERASQHNLPDNDVSSDTNADAGRLALAMMATHCVSTCTLHSVRLLANVWRQLSFESGFSFIAIIVELRV